MGNINKTKEKLPLIFKSLPDKPGVYQFYDKYNNIIYVGKAKNLKKRVNSYFINNASVNGKIKVLVSKIENIEYIIVENEFEALLLENTLIKKYQPRYNVMLKDDKTYPWISIKNEPFPRIMITRNYVNDGSKYFGPYASVKMIQTLFELIRNLYPLRTCRLKLTKQNIKAKKFKVCLEYHMKNCKAPCIGNVTEEEYNNYIENIEHILKGNIHSVTHHLKALMFQYAKKLEFEKANIIKEQLLLLEKYKGKSVVVNPNINNVDVFNIITEENIGYVNFLKIINGSIVQSHTIELHKKLEETEEELLLLAITELRQRFDSNSNEIIVPFNLNVTLSNIIISVPKRGDKKQLLDLSESNLKHYILEKKKQKELVDPNIHTNKILEKLKNDLKMNTLPKRIECFDNSNIQGYFAVASMVCFINGKPNKKEYRRFNIKTVEGPNDYASMEEIVYRRYKRALEENLPLPELIIIDGGKGQLNSAIKSLERLNLTSKIKIIAIAKKLEEIYTPDDPLPLYIDKKTESLKLIQRIRDEAHRFAISYHRNKREKNLFKSELAEIKGIGEKTMIKLLKKFNSLKNISVASFDEIAELIGKHKANILYQHLKKT